MIEIDDQLEPQQLLPALDRLWRVSGERLWRLEQRWEDTQAAPVITVNGIYQPRGWTEWTQGFQYGSLLLQFDATDDRAFLDCAQERIVQRMPDHVTHTGVHDHGFNVVSTYGALWRLMREQRLAADPWEQRYYALALCASGAVQAARWTATEDGGGFIYSFNGPHSLFVDTIRSCRSLALAHQLRHSLRGEHDQRIDLLQRLILHLRSTARYNVWYGEGRDVYDVAGRTAHEAVFHPGTGVYRCPSTQQGYSPFSTWTRGLAWAILGFAEQLEWLGQREDEEFLEGDAGNRTQLEEEFLRAALATADYYLQETPSCGVPYWDTGAPGLTQLAEPTRRPADPWNDFEPVDSSAAAIAAQGLLRLGSVCAGRGRRELARRYRQAGLTVLRTLLQPPYLQPDAPGEGLLLHTIYHRPHGWDYVPEGRKIPCGESCQWGDYHLREVALYVQRAARGEPDYTFFGP